MTGPAEFGVQWLAKSGRLFVAGGYTETGARGIVAACGGPANEPKAVAVVRRPAVDWQPDESPERGQ